MALEREQGEAARERVPHESLGLYPPAVGTHQRVLWQLLLMVNLQERGK